MKHFIIINGKDVFIREKELLLDAITWAENYCDHSKEIIVREINPIADVNGINLLIV